MVGIGELRSKPAYTKVMAGEYATEAKPYPPTLKIELRKDEESQQHVSQ